MRRQTGQMTQTPDAPPAANFPTLTDQLFIEAVTRHQHGQLPQAEALYRAIIAIHPAPADASYNLGLLLQHQSRHADAITAYRHAITVRPGYIEAYSNLGTVLQDMGRLDDAIAIYREGIGHRPDYAMTYANLGTALKEQGHLEEAIAAYRQSLVLNPRSDAAYANLAAALVELQHFDEAVDACNRAIAINPASTMAHCNLAAAHKAQNQLEPAASAYRNAIAASPQFPEAHFGLAQILLLQGDLVAGWEEYEWRWKLREYGWLQNMHGTFAQPRWNGETLDGRRILIYAEQGLGDAIQFVRFIPEVKKAGGHVILAVHPPLVKLFSGLPDIEVVPLDAKLPPFDVHSPLLTLPRIFATGSDSIPQTIPYLHADPALITRWRQRIASEKLKVGVVWAGNPGQRGDKLRSPHLTAMSALFATPGVDFFALQLGEGRREIEAFPLPANVTDLGGEIGDFADTAAIMSGLDLVITSCTAPLHMAGALGIPTWAVLPYAPHFFWLLDKPDSAWYPTLRLYRQQAPIEGWAPVIEQVATDLSGLAANHAQPVGKVADEVFA